ncbi:deoxyribose-phosphate aldolase [Abyssalbus ytuae]|uniref:Deoxyribose-phosphate aldolase n=1 Tax=Abyssalbus ytuae TaxID=2926907 RepID=A0A9E6ZNL2_9FLAO|nr:deoxyribose-phosphate aldolase [Abyssalbus ytuae]UOB17640.1 deoxyribose-phosphate aldolase [Abyssalbus ytuae]
MKLNKFIDHTLLKPVATPEEIEILCNEAVKYDFFSVCVNSCHVSFATKLLSDTNVKVCTVVGFPLGAMCTRAKAFEAENAVKDGAAEIDMVMNLGWLKSNRPLKVIQDIAEIKKAIGENVLKVIIETCYLTDEEKKLASELAIKANADFVKTSTGFGNGGATLPDIDIIKKAIHSQAKIKASGGIRDFDTAIQYIKAGVSRIGTSNGINIVTGFHQKTNDY